MKKSIIVAMLFFSCISIEIFAQENVHFFQIEKETFLQFEKFAPNTILECYSSPQGGKFMNKVKMNAFGEGSHIFAVENSPAFVLNRKTSENLEGTDRVQTMDVKEFNVKNIILKVIAEEVQISWDAQIPRGNMIEFQITKNEDSRGIQIVKTYIGVNGTDFNNYSFKEPYSPNTTYTIQIVKDRKKIRYVSKPLSQLMSDEKIKVYPTNCIGKIYVDTENTTAVGEYAILNLSGVTVQRGALTAQHNRLDIHNLAQGIYLINIHQGIERYTTKFFKN